MLMTDLHRMTDLPPVNSKAIIRQIPRLSLTLAFLGHGEIITMMNDKFDKRETENQYKGKTKRLRYSQ